MRSRIDSHRYPANLCFWCSKPLPQKFTSIRVRGATQPVHYECRREAAARYGVGLVADWLDYEDLPV